jgi:hypothetical protein
VGISLRSLRFGSMVRQYLLPLEIVGTSNQPFGTSILFQPLYRLLQLPSALLAPALLAPALLAPAPVPAFQAPGQAYVASDSSGAHAATQEKPKRKRSRKDPTSIPRPPHLIATPLSLELFPPLRQRDASGQRRQVPLSPPRFLRLLFLLTPVMTPARTTISRRRPCACRSRLFLLNCMYLDQVICQFCVQIPLGNRRLV